MPTTTPDHLLEETIRLLGACNLRTSVLARKAGVKYHWLRNFRKGITNDPGVDRLTRLYKALTNVS